MCANAETCIARKRNGDRRFSLNLVMTKLAETSCTQMSLTFFGDEFGGSAAAFPSARNSVPGALACSDHRIQNEIFNSSRTVRKLLTLVAQEPSVITGFALLKCL